MCHSSLSNPSFLHALFVIDQELAQFTRDHGCTSCGAPLHCANYERKPKGLTTAMPESFKLRFSLCCSDRECRKRHTPPSVRFLGRRAYLGVIVVLAAVLQQGLSGHREKYLRRFNIYRQTLHRWMVWWKEHFPSTDVWRDLRGRFPTAVALPLDPLLAMKGDDIDTKMRQWLFQLLPLTTPSAHCLEGVNFPQKM